VRSARTSCVLSLSSALVLAGCVSTQQIASRARLVNDRIMAGQRPTQVTDGEPAVRVGRPAVIRSRSATAIVVPLSNQSATALTDLPISVGISTRSGQKLYLNRSTTLDYFETHVAVIGPRRATAWVFITDRRVPVKATPFATVGFPQFHPQLSGGLPHIDVSWPPGAVTSPADGAARASVTSRSGVPQYDLQVYVIAVRAGHTVAAGRATIPHLASYGRTTVRVTLIGDPTRATLRPFAPPTIFS